MDPTKSDPFQDVVARSVARFSESVAEMIQTMFGATCALSAPTISDDGLKSERNFFVSILFTGMVYGEYILAADERTVAGILGHRLEGKTDAELDLLRQEMSEAFCELLNLVVGQSVVGLSQAYQKLTITPPRVYFGALRYPKVKTGRAELRCEAGGLECYLYVDRMKLDLAASYKEAMSSIIAAHRELQSAMKKLQTQQTLLVQSEKMAALGTMAAGVAHEINTPLATVSLVGGQLKERIQTEVEIDRASFAGMLDVVDKTVSRIAKITNSMRIFATQARSVEMSASSLNQVLDGALLVCESQLRERGAELRYERPRDALTVECWSAELSQALAGVIGNACDALETLDEKWIRVEIAETETSVAVKVTDPGKGIPADIREKIFDPFFTTKEIGKGAGLGLSVARALIARHGGEIRVDDGDANTCLVVTLPKRSAKAVAA